MKLTSARVSAISAWGMTLYGALLPFHALGTLQARRFTWLEPCDAVLVAFAPAVLWQMFRSRRRLFGSWIVRGVALLSVAGVLAEALAQRPSLLVLGEEALGVLALGGVASAVWSGRGRQLSRGVLVGGAVALAVAALGYGLMLLGCIEPSGAFVFSSDHPVFSRWPRMTGTLGRHAVWLGEYAVMLLAVALAADAGVASRRLRHGVAIAAGLALFGSLSFAWFGGLVLALGWAVTRQARAGAPRARYRAIAGLVLALAYAAVSFWMIVGARVEPARYAAPRPCRELDGAHHVLRRGFVRGMCEPVLGAEPYPHRLTLYALAHDTAWQRFSEQPLLGGGRSAYGKFARKHAARAHSLDAVGYYHKPVGLLAASLAYTGLLGSVALAAMLYGVWRARPPSSTPEGAWRWLFYGAAGLLLSGVHTDMELRGPLWVLLGLLVGETRSPRRVSPNIDERPNARTPNLPVSTRPSPGGDAARPGTDLGHEVLAFSEPHDRAPVAASTPRG